MARRITIQDNYTKAVDDLMGMALQQFNISRNRTDRKSELEYRKEQGAHRRQREQMSDEYNTSVRAVSMLQKQTPFGKSSKQYSTTRKSYIALRGQTKFKGSQDLIDLAITSLDANEKATNDYNSFVSNVDDLGTRLTKLGGSNAYAKDSTEFRNAVAEIGKVKMSAISSAPASYQNAINKKFGEMEGTLQLLDAIQGLDKNTAKSGIQTGGLFGSNSEYNNAEFEKGLNAALERGDYRTASAYYGIATAPKKIVSNGGDNSVFNISKYKSLLKDLNNQGKNIISLRKTNNPGDDYFDDISAAPSPININLDSDPQSISDATNNVSTAINNVLNNSEKETKFAKSTDAIGLANKLFGSGKYTKAEAVKFVEDNFDFHKWSIGSGKKESRDLVENLLYLHKANNLNIQLFGNNAQSATNKLPEIPEDPETPNDPDDKQAMLDMFNQKKKRAEALKKAGNEVDVLGDLFP